MSLSSQLTALTVRVASECRDLWEAINGREPKFSKNTAFNKNFGDTEGTVTEGNDHRLSDMRMPLDSSVTAIKLSPQFRHVQNMPSLDVNWQVAQVFKKTLETNSTLSFSNLHVGVKDLEITGDYALNLPPFVKVISGTYDGTRANLIQVICTNSTPGNEQGWCVISQEET